MVSKKERINQQWQATQSDQKVGIWGNKNRERGMLENLLSDNEPVEAWLPGMYTPDFGEKSGQPFDGVVVATDRRVLFLKSNPSAWGTK